MRIYELAKEAGVTSVEVLKAAEESDIEVSSAISTVDDGEAETLRSALKKAAKGDHEGVRATKRNLAAELNAKFFAEQKAKLEKHLAIAKAAAEGGEFVIEPPEVVEEPVKPTKAEAKAEEKPEQAPAADPAPAPAAKAEAPKAAPAKAPAPVPAPKPV